MMHSSPRSVAKPVLKPQFTIHWPDTPKVSTDLILSHLRDRLESLKFYRPKAAKKSPPRKRAKLEEDQHGERSESATNDSNWNNAQIKSQLALGLNQVLRALERKQLRVVIVDSDYLKPKTLSYFMGLAAKDSGAIVGSLKALSESLAKTMKLKAVRTFGIRKIDLDSKMEDFFASEVDLIRQHLRPVEMKSSLLSDLSKSEIPTKLKYVSPSVITPLVKPKTKKKLKN